MVKDKIRPFKIITLILIAVLLVCIVVIISMDTRDIKPKDTVNNNDTVQTESQTQEPVEPGEPETTPDTDPIINTEQEEILNEQRKKDEATEKFLGDIGVDKENPVKTESGATLVGNAAKTVKNFKTLAEAEEDMGYYLGLHNSIKSDPDYSLVGIYNIGKEWYQALYEDANNAKPSITLKVSSNTSEEDLIKPYKEAGYTEKSDTTIKEIKVTVEGKDDMVNLVHFTINNGRAYSLYSVTALDKVDMEKIATELIENLKTMEDWVD